MEQLYGRWKSAKDEFFKADLDTNSVPQDFVVNIDQGFGFGPALKTFDAADTIDKRLKSIVAVLKAKDGYATEVEKALRATKDAAARKALTKLKLDLDGIWIDANAAAQPPRPSAQMVHGLTLRSFNLSDGAKPVFLKLDPIKVDVSI
jgi:hypothetical protein